MTRRTAIEALAASPAAAGLVLDFDGVLSPIVDVPSASRMPGPTAAALAQLAGPLGLLAVISGRPLDFLAERARVPGVQLLGSYGIERIGADGQRWVDPQARPWLGAVQEAGQELAEVLAGLPGVVIERKSVSVAAHWRTAPDTGAAAAAVREAIGRVAGRTGLLLEPGKFVEELRPPIDVDKGSALADLLSAGNVSVIAYAGDDKGDKPALRAARSSGGYALVVDHGTETDPELLELADQAFAGTGAFAAWLTELADAIAAPRTPRGAC